ncbi:hypothetical protein ZA02_01570 [Campylobacter lanienae]|uniref:putative barnase/colicin E5 family endoribonuclease n=1 Tax=Campylobacter lanienae TaxID=75658 RepID=UPI0011AC1F0C|nr:RNA polymerase-binding protein DksA [Campylobacter lanienae]TWO17369.1 hypothetical protein ZA02_01570 [Campylobacter lanienae]
MAEFILLNKAILNANGDFKLAIKNIENIPDGNLPTPTRNLLNEFKEAVKEIEKQVVKADNQAENQVNLANQLNGGNIDSLTQQMTYLQNALKNQSKDAPTPSTAIKQEVDSLSQATPNLAQNSIKGDGFVTYPNSAKQIYPHNAIFEVPNEIRQIADIGDRVSASLEWLRSNHPEMFKTQRAVKEVIDYVLKEPENIVSPKKGDGVILSKQNDKKMDEIGINQNSEVFHANKRKLNSNEKKAVSGDALPPHLDADNISLTGRYSVGGKPHLTANEPMAETPKSQRKQQVLGVQMNTSKEHFSSANAETIPNQSIKEAEIAKDLTQDAPSELYKAHRKAQKAKEALKPQEPQAKSELMATTAKPQEPTPQAKADEADINPKSNYKKHERPIELDFKEAIDKGFNVDINALKHFYKNGGGSPLNYMREYMAELDQIEKKALGNEAKDRLKALYENFFYSVKAVERHRPNQIAEYSSIGGQKEFEKIKEFRNEIEKAPTNQKALDALEKIEFVNNLENSPAFKLAKRQKTMKKEFIKEARNALKQATNLALKPLSQFLIKYGKSEEFLTKSSIISKIELENARGLRELKLNIRPIREFGTNYAEFYRDGQNAIKKLLTERQGQVAGAFERQELGDIDLVWGEFKVVNGEIKGYGLSKIEAKHLNDFAIFKGDTPQEKLINGIAEIIEKGEIKPRSGQNGVNIEYNGFIIGINKGFNGAGDNKWVVTAFDNSISKSEKKAKTARTDNFTSEVNNLSQNSKPNSTPKEIKSQAQVEQKAGQYAKWLSQADKIPPQAPDELYKAYDKAKRT